MVVPTSAEQETPAEPGVRIVRDEEGVFYGFQDADTGRFISRQDALGRLVYSIEQGALLDSFGNTAGVGSIALPNRGVQVTYANVTADYMPLTTDPLTYTPESNQEIVERVIFVNQDGTLSTLQTSYGLGTMYDPNLTGGRWRRGASQALGLDESERLPTADLERAVIYREFELKTIST